MENRTKIICTIGPASEDPAILEKMMRAGMDCVRLNFSHGNYEEYARIICAARKIAEKLGRQIAILQDLQGPKIRLGELPEAGIEVATGDTVILSVNKEKNTVPIQYRALPHDVKHGDMLLINDGLIELTVEGINAASTQIRCRVKIGGLLQTHKGINAPTASLSADPLSPKDRRDIQFGIEHDVDYIGLSFVKDAKTVLELKRILKNRHSSASVIAKIERHEAITAMDGIIRASDAVMVARGDLGIEIPAEQVPLQQKKIIHLGNLYGKPVIVATQMLDSMVSNPRATRAEISDAATAIFDHADAMLLSNETAVGRYPVEATRTLQKVAGAVERDLAAHRHLLTIKSPQDMPITNATCLNACKLAQDISAKFIVAVTRSGYTAREIAKYRPFIPVIVFTPDVHVARQLQIVWGVTKTFVQYIHLGNPLAQIRQTLKQHGIVKRGDEIVVCNAGFGRREKLITTTMI